MAEFSAAKAVLATVDPAVRLGQMPRLPTGAVPRNRHATASTKLLRTTLRSTTMNHNVLLSVLVLGSVCAPGVAIGTADADQSIEPLLLSNQFMVVGEVVTRGDVAFTIVGPGAQLTTVYVSPDTSILKGAETIQLADVFVGDKVSVVTMRSADGKLQAVRVEVKTGYE